MVAGTLALALNARRREFAVLRAMGATPGQVLSMVGAEALLLAGLASTLGALPGFALAEGMRRVFARVGVMPESLVLSFSPIPVLVAVALTVLTAWLGAITVASGPAHIRPVEAMRDASREARQPAGWRTIVGLICVALGLGAALIPIGLRSDAGTAGTSSAALLLVIGLALAGPFVLRPLVTVVTRPLRRFGVSGFLAAENSEAQVRRLGGVLMPLLLAIGFTLPMVYSQTILAQAVTDQIEEGITADVVIADTGSGGIDPDVLAAIQSLPETGTVTAVQDTQILLPYSIFGDPDVTQTTARGISADGITTTLDPDIVSGDLTDLTGSTIAVDRSTARIISAQVGDDIEVVLGDGTSTTLTVVAVYDRGLGLGGAILPSQVLDRHAAAPTQALISADGSATSDALHAALADLLARYPTLTIADQATLADQSRSETMMTSWVNLTGLVVIVAFISITVVNNLVMATLERAREFSLLRLIGTTRAQILRMLCYEALVITVLAIVLGSLIATIPLTVLSLAFLGNPLPAASPWVYIGVIATAAVLALTSTLTPATRILRQPTTSTIGIRE
nr:ABC transporter permease [Brevibacterium paucivorans]